MGRGHGQALKRVIVTGGSGFLGRRLIEMLLERGYEVRALLRGPCPHLEKLPAKIEFVQGSLESRLSLLEACRERDLVFHCAAKTGLGGCWADYHVPNLEGTLNLLEACRYHKIRRFVYTSSPSVTFQYPGSRGGDESLPYPENFLSHYAETKALAEKAVIQANGWGGMATTALRPHLIWGAGDPHLVPGLLDAARRGLLTQVGDGSNLVDLTHVDNAAWAHILAAEHLHEGSANAGKAYFISDGQPLCLWTWIASLLRELGMPPVPRTLPLPVAFSLGRLCEWLYRTLRLEGDPPMTRFLACELALPHFYEIEAARRDFAYRVLVEPQEGWKLLVNSLKGASSLG